MKGCVLPGLLLLVLAARSAFSGGHSHYFYSTLTYNLSFDFPSFYSTRTIDNITLFWYDSDSGVIERRVPWFKGANASLLKASYNEYRFHRAMLSILNNTLNYLNHTEGYHILQNIDGCTLLENGTANIIRRYNYNGKILMFFDWETSKWTAEMPEYEDLVSEIFGNDTATEEDKNILLNVCIPHITELLLLGKCTIDRKEAPVVKVTQIPIDNVGVRLYCRAYGHYPEEILIMWYKNGQEISEAMMERVTLPLPDLTYLTSLSVNVTSANDDVYTCKVNHISMLQNFTKDWRISGDFANLSSVSSKLSIGAVIAICLAIILVIVVIVFVSVSFAKSRRP